MVGILKVFIKWRNIDIENIKPMRLQEKEKAKDSWNQIPGDN